MMRAIERVVTVLVDVEPDVAFDVFTARDRSLVAARHRVPRRRTPAGHARPRAASSAAACSSSTRARGAALHEAGTVTAWEPPRRLAFEWRGSNFAPGEVTLVDVTFTRTESGATERGSCIVGSRRCGRIIRCATASRPTSFIGRLGRWWGDLLTASGSTSTRVEWLRMGPPLLRVRASERADRQHQPRDRKPLGEVPDMGADEFARRSRGAHGTAGLGPAAARGALPPVRGSPTC